MFVFKPPHEHFSYLLGNTHWVEENVWSNPFLLYKPDQHTATKAACPMEHPSLCFRTKNEQISFNFLLFASQLCSRLRLGRGGHTCRYFFLQGPLLSLKPCWEMLSLAHERAALEIQQTKTCWRALVLTSPSRCAATAWPGRDGRQLML